MRPDPNPQQGDVGWLMDEVCVPCRDGEHDYLDDIPHDEYQLDDGPYCICCGKPRQWTV